MTPAPRKRKHNFSVYADEDDDSDSQTVDTEELVMGISDGLPSSLYHSDGQPIVCIGSTEGQGKVTRSTIRADGPITASSSSSGSRPIGFDTFSSFNPDNSPPPPLEDILLESPNEEVTIPSAPSLVPYENSWFFDIGGNEEEQSDVDEESARMDPAQTLHGEWAKEYREAYLREMIWLEGRGRDPQAYCAGCKAEDEVVYRCMSCIGAELLCQTCIVSTHLHNPFHFVEIWNGEYFECRTLKSLGLLIQLGHAPGRSCANPAPSRHNDFVVVDTTGIHEVNLSFCRCDGMKPHFVQLLHYGLFPGTGVDPRTASTFQALKFFQLMSFESKGSHQEFYRAIERLTGNVLSKSSRDRYHEFMGMVSQWRHLKLLKRAGRGHDLGGISGTTLGSCALRCPSCPQPGINLPDGWDAVPQEERWKYRLFVSIDGNFKLRRRLVSSNEKDPGLNQGWSYFVEENGFKEHLVSKWHLPQDRSTCVAHEAVDKPDRQARGLAASGVAAGVCMRHEFRLPNGVGDLQHGERYINVDYIAFSAVQWFKILELVISYDIGCQWHKKLIQRLAALPAALQPTFLEALLVLIPKFHLPAHIEACNRSYSFNLTKGVGRTDGEAPERGWSRMNAIAKSTAEMGPGTRRDTLDDHMADENWGKTKKCAETFIKKMERAIHGKRKFEQDYSEYRSSMPATFVSRWVAQVERWESDPSHNPNPYEAETKGGSTTARAGADAADAAEAEEVGDSPSNLGVVQPSLFISSGIQLEEDQYKLRIAASQLGNHPTKKQLTNLAERSNTLRRRIAVWIEVQRLYMPEAESCRLRHDSASTAVEGKPSTEAYDIPLLFPSSLPASLKCTPDLISYEAQLREGQAYDALEELRRYLRNRSYLYKRKDKNSKGSQTSVAANTRSNTAIKRAQQGVDTAAIRYTQAYNALMKLWDSEEDASMDEPQWRRDLQKLKASDIRGLSEGLYGDSEGKRGISWIWKSWSASLTSASEDDIENDEQLEDALHIEFLKSCTRAARWAEEVELLQEEMRRTLVFFQQKADWWNNRRKSTIGGSTSDYEEGFSAYALSQSRVYTTLRLECERQWEEGRARNWVKRPQKGGQKKRVTPDEDVDVETLLDED